MCYLIVFFLIIFIGFSYLKLGKIEVIDGRGCFITNALDF